MIGPVQENETNTRVNAINMIDTKPVVDSALASIFDVHEAGKVISNAPKNDTANTTNIKKKMMLKIALVERAFKAEAPKIPVTKRPRVK